MILACVYMIHDSSFPWLFGERLPFMRRVRGYLQNSTAPLSWNAVSPTVIARFLNRAEVCKVLSLLQYSMGFERLCFRVRLWVFGRFFTADGR